MVLDEDLEFDVYWKGRIAKSRNMLGALNGIGNSQWGVSANSWRSAYTGMVRTIASWGAEIGWRGQVEWKEAIRRLQYAALRKCTGAVMGARKESVDKIAAVESVETFLISMQDRFVARAIGDPRGVGDLLRRSGRGGELGETERELLEHATGTLVEGHIEWGGTCPRTEVGVVELHLVAQAKPWEWEQAAGQAARDRRVVFTDGSKEEGCNGMVGGGWFENENMKGTMTVGRKATVWDGEIAGLEGALRMVGNTPVLLLTDSRAAIQAVQKAGKRGVARTRGLAEVVRRLAAIDEEHGEGSAVLGWVKAHVGITGNERADEQAKLAAEGRNGAAVTEGGI